MSENTKHSALVSGVFFIVGMAVLGWFLGNAVTKFKGFERTVTVKGLAEREYPADIVIWPIQFTEANNDLQRLYGAIENSTSRIRSYLQSKGIDSSEITIASPAITDMQAQRYGGSGQTSFRYNAVQTVTVYSKNIEAVRAVMGDLSQLGKQGIVITGGDYQSRTEYLFTRLNDIKPEMIEEATKQARVVALKFAEDSQSKLGKIKRAYQGQFSISPRDKNNPHIQRVRVVSTIEYYLSD